MPSTKNRFQILDLHPKKLYQKYIFFYDAIKLE